MCCSGNVDVLQWNRKWFFFRHVKFDSGFHVMAIKEISHNRPEIIFSFRIFACWVILKRIWRREFVWFSSKNFLFLSLVQDDPWLMWMVSDVDFLQGFDCLICDREYENCHLSLASTLLLHWAFWRGVLMRPSPPILQCLRPWCLLSRFSPRIMHNREVCLARLLGQIDVISICPSQK